MTAGRGWIHSPWRQRAQAFMNTWWAVVYANRKPAVYSVPIISLAADHSWSWGHYDSGSPRMPGVERWRKDAGKQTGTLPAAPSTFAPPWTQVVWYCCKRPQGEAAATPSAHHFRYSSRNGFQIVCRARKKMRAWSRYRSKPPALTHTKPDVYSFLNRIHRSIWQPVPKCDVQSSGMNILRQLLNFVKRELTRMYKLVSSLWRADPQTKTRTFPGTL